MVQKVLQLQCSYNQYPWGRRGSKSAVARLCAKTPGTDFVVDEDKCYSEMWMGTYPTLPSLVLQTGESLQQVLDQHPEDLIGKDVVEKFGKDLPFLPKILSIDKALPLQIHPNKALAQELHRKDPANFADDNHKPEIAIALTEFEAFCGFKPLHEIETLMNFEPLKQFLPKIRKADFDDQTLKHVIRSMLATSEDTIIAAIDALMGLSPESFAEGAAYIPNLLARLQNQYGKTDPGSLVALITMNYLVLSPGESIYIPADGVHAYLSGDIVECMARSNNVLNSGFCPKSDRHSVDLFCTNFTFSPHSPEECMLRPKPYHRCSESHTKVYTPPMSEFSMLATELSVGEKENFLPIRGPSVAVVTRGRGAKMYADGKEFDLNEGYVFCIGQDVKFEVHAGDQDGLQMFTAFVE